MRLLALLFLLAACSHRPVAPEADRIGAVSLLGDELVLDVAAGSLLRSGARTLDVSAWGVDNTFRDLFKKGLVERGKAALQRLEDGLAESPFLIGEGLSLADVALAAYTRVAHEGGFRLEDYPRVCAWIGRVETALAIHT